jgi:hypothetical protein
MIKMEAWDDIEAAPGRAAPTTHYAGDDCVDLTARRVLVDATRDQLALAKRPQPLRFLARLGARA